MTERVGKTYKPRPEYSASFWKGQVEAQVVLATGDKMTLILGHHNHGTETHWTVSRENGTREDLVAFIEEWLPKCPDPELINEGLGKLSAQIPEGLL